MYGFDTSDSKVKVYLSKFRAVFEGLSFALTFRTEYYNI